MQVKRTCQTVSRFSYKANGVFFSIHKISNVSNLKANTNAFPIISTILLESIFLCAKKGLPLSIDKKWDFFSEVIFKCQEANWSFLLMFPQSFYLEHCFRQGSCDKSLFGLFIVHYRDCRRLHSDKILGKNILKKKKKKRLMTNIAV